MASTIKDATAPAQVKPAAKPATKPAAKPAAKKLAVKKPAAAKATPAKPAAVKPERVKPGPKPGAKAAAAKTTDMHGKPEVAGYAAQPKSSPTGRGSMVDEGKAKDPLTGGRSGNLMASILENKSKDTTKPASEADHVERNFAPVDPSASTELLSTLHHNESARLALGQALAEVRRIQIENHQHHTGDSGHRASQESELLTFGQTRGVKPKAYVLINGEVCGSTSQYRITSESIKFDLETVNVSFPYTIHNPAYPEALAKFTGIVLDRPDMKDLERAYQAHQRLLHSDAEEAISQRLVEAHQVEYKRGDRIRSLITPTDIFLVLERKEVDLFQAYSNHYQRNPNPPADLVVIKIAVYTNAAGEKHVSSLGGPIYVHSTLFELLPYDKLKLTAANADFDGDALNTMANLTK